MNRKLAAVLVTLSLAAGVGVGFLTQRNNTGGAGAESPGTTPTPSSSASGTPEPSPAALTVANRADRAAAGLPSWSPADPTGPDGAPLEIGDIVPGGIEPVLVGRRVFEYMHAGLLRADQDPPCDGNSWRWAGQLSGGLHVAATQGGTITALGTDKDLLETGDGLGVGSSLRAIRATYGDTLSEVVPDDYGVGWVSVQTGRRWIAFSLGRADQVTDTSRADYIEVGRGEVLHHFSDAC
jgi:hypothetical protein